MELDSTSLAFTLQQTLERIAERFLGQPDEIAVLRQLERVISRIGFGCRNGNDDCIEIPFDMNLWRIQNIYYRVLQDNYLEFQSRARNNFV